jgi:hypothetical protein
MDPETKQRIAKVIAELQENWRLEVPVPVKAGEKYTCLGQEHITDGRELLIDTRNPKHYPIRIRHRPGMEEMVIISPERGIPCGQTFDVVEVNVDVVPDKEETIAFLLKRLDTMLYWIDEHTRSMVEYQKINDVALEQDELDNLQDAIQQARECYQDLAKLLKKPQDQWPLRGTT